MSVQSVLEPLATVRTELEELYRDLHAHPELSHEEHRTAGLVAQRLRADGFEVHEGVDGTGVVGVLGHGEGPVVLLRADMDALPVREATGLDYASTATAADGEPVMHACGHDVHVTALLGAAHLLAVGSQHWSGTLVALFQPGEEHGDGAHGWSTTGWPISSLRPTSRSGSTSSSPRRATSAPGPARCSAPPTACG